METKHPDDCKCNSNYHHEVNCACTRCMPENNVIQFPNKENEITDEDFEVFMKALLGPYKGSGYRPE